MLFRSDAGQSGQLFEQPNFLFLRMIELAIPSSPLKMRERKRENERKSERVTEGTGKGKEGVMERGRGREKEGERERGSE